jgi:hypothetical protein
MIKNPIFDQSTLNKSESPEDLKSQYEALLRNHYPESFVNNVTATDESTSKFLGAPISHEKHGNLIVRYADGPKKLGIMGLFSTTGRVRPSDAPALKSWLGKVRSSLDSGKEVYVSLNHHSGPLFERALKGGQFNVETLHEHSFPWGKWKTVKVTKPATAELEKSNSSPDDYVYHSTYLKNLPSIARHGLGSLGVHTVNPAWSEIKNPSHTYLAADQHSASDYAVTAENISDHDANNIVTFRIHKKHLDPNHIHPDENAPSDVGNIAYSKQIPPHHLEIHEDLTEKQNAKKLWSAYTSGALKKSNASAPSVKLNPEHGKIIANAYHQMKHDPSHPEVKAAYGALIEEMGKQFQEMLDQGFKISSIKPGQSNPYKNSKEVHEDIRRNKHLWFFPTSEGYGSEGESPKDHPLLQPTKFMHNGKPLLANDVFRIVHDYRGHHLGGESGFGPKGEHQAFLTHRKDLSPLAQKALASETLGQNSWVNFGPHGEQNRKNPENTIYAEQKAGLLPDDIINGRWHE